MVALSEIYKDVKAQNIRLFQYDLGDLADAAILRTARGYGVFLDFAQYRTLRDYKAALSHEVGHCATGSLHRVDSPFELIARNEYRADKWMIERYFPAGEFRKAFRQGYREPWELAEWFDMPQRVVEQALHYWTDCRGLHFSPEEGEP